MITYTETGVAVSNNGAFAHIPAPRARELVNSPAVPAPAELADGAAAEQVVEEPQTFEEQLAAFQRSKVAAAAAEVSLLEELNADRRQAVVATVLDRARAELHAKSRGTPYREIAFDDPAMPDFMDRFVELMRGSDSLPTVTLYRTVKPPEAKPEPAPQPSLAATAERRNGRKAAKTLAQPPQPAQAVAEVPAKPTYEVAQKVRVLADLGWVMREPAAKSPKGRDVWTSLHPKPEFAYLCEDGMVRCFPTRPGEGAQFWLDDIDTESNALPRGADGKPVVPVLGSFESITAEDFDGMPVVGDFQVLSAAFVPSKTSLRQHLVNIAAKAKPAPVA